MTTYTGYCSFATLAEFVDHLADFKALHNPALYDELIDWLGDNVITEDAREGYEEEWPTKVVVHLHPDGKVWVEL